MPPGGVHLAVGVGVVRWLLPVLPRVVPARHGHALRAAAVFGSIVPVRARSARRCGGAAAPARLGSKRHARCCVSLASLTPAPQDFDLLVTSAAVALTKDKTYIDTVRARAASAALRWNMAVFLGRGRQRR